MVYCCVTFQRNLSCVEYIPPVMPVLILVQQCDYSLLPKQVRQRTHSTINPPSQ